MPEVQVDYRVVEILNNITALVTDHASPVTVVNADPSRELQKIVDHLADIVDEGEFDVTFP